VRRNNFNLTFPGQWNILEQVHGPVFHERHVAGTKWVQREPPDNLIPLAMNFPY
jgi:hypothetical protein